MEDSPSGLWRTLGKRVGVTASRVRISYPPPGFEPRKPLKTFGFRGFALIPPIVGSPRVPSVSTPLAPTRRACHISEPTIPKTPPAPRPPRVRHRSPAAPHAPRGRAVPDPLMPPRSFFRFGSQQSRTPATQRDAPHAAPPSAKVPPDPLRQTPHERIRVPQQPIRTVNRLLDT